ncbi:MAG: LPXTG cell wall anchor domain-containing protein [Terrisporobacter sp.]|uniref:LPXTG cell wall anchor domain-containing protein n=1 Tax=Terrisporobacter sp. TaxID=1965305 RepID=UPI002FC9FA16
MKKIVTLLLVCLSIMLVGCVNTDVTLDIDKNGNSSVSMKLLTSDYLSEGLNESDLQNIKEEYQADTIEAISENGQSGYLLTKKLGNLKETQSVKDDNTMNEYFEINKESGFLFDVYDVNIKIKDALFSDMTAEEKSMLSYFGTSANMNFHVKTPFELLESNATSTNEEEGKTVYNWNYNLNTLDNIHVKFKFINIVNIGVIIAGVILLAGLGIYFYKRKRNNKEV